ncbi:hypothetical protein [Salinicola socius]|uniref:Uncharacterized protein n=1 Tax=Salinicola socius TaxID=404433 RepID=A0A1Q8SPG2_9GAMM|nr:hypothetical protein [Salinicola socius]OLO03309.1 hypothetical protein BTW07_14590 [Salinicola socius]
MTHHRPICIDIDVTTDERLLEAVRQQHGLATIDQASEFLARRRVRNSTRKVGGPRALYPVR